MYLLDTNIVSELRKAKGACVLRYDNESGKGDHKHVDDQEVKYRFVSVDKLVADFFEDVKRWRDENSND